MDQRVGKKSESSCVAEPTPLPVNSLLMQLSYPHRSERVWVLVAVWAFVLSSDHVEILRREER